ncbi:nodulin-related protein 1 [Phalaenopsis equestris]|uniref:nodulin-related protein 1 n=1 Tax=Phalaenopsis equestris TaxID=78828 RepID=UPI0009E40CE2|nr:nodulin-related protein 1 [Phalaenopsis equestris]
MDSHPDNTNTSFHPQPSPAQLLSSAKVVANAAKSALRHESAELDKAKLAEAAEDLLNAASHYGKIEEKSYGKYVQKAESYLHQYHYSHSSSTSQITSSTAHSSSAGHSVHGGGGVSDGGFGDYLKLAEGFLKKH